MNLTPTFHFDRKQDKLTNEWCKKVVQYYKNWSALSCPIEGKNIVDIEQYSSGKYNLDFVKRIFRSVRKDIKNLPKSERGIAKSNYNALVNGAPWQCLPLLPPVINTTVSKLQERKIVVDAKCVDGLAVKNKKHDVDILVNKPKIDALMQDLYDEMGLGEYEGAETEHGDVAYNKVPMGLDLKDPKELELFTNLIYKLAPESAFKVALNAIFESRNVGNVVLMERLDQIKYGVSCHRVFVNEFTGLLDAEYLYPGNVRCDGGTMPDYSDRTVTQIRVTMTPYELMARFPNEITKDILDLIVNGREANGRKDGYHYANTGDTSYQNSEGWGTYKMDLWYTEIISNDTDYVSERKPQMKANGKLDGKGKYGNFKYITKDKESAIGAIHSQNTYCFYHLNNTEHFFGKSVLDYAYRRLGNERCSAFSINIYRSQPESMIELCIGENKRAQIADVKLMQTIVLSGVPGKAVDLKGVREMIDRMTDVDATQKEAKMQEMVQDIIENNIVLYDSEGFEGKQGGQYKPVQELAGGLGNEILGYYKVIAECKNNIREYSGVNQQLMGQDINPDMLVGLQQSAIQSSLNSISYIDRAIESQYKYLFNFWGYGLQAILKKGGSPKEAILNLIGDKKVKIIEGLNKVPLHTVGINIRLGQRMEEREMFKMKLSKSSQDGVINDAEYHWILSIEDEGDAMVTLGIIQNKHKRELQEQAQLNRDAMLQVEQQRGQNLLQNTNAQAQINAQKEQFAAQQQEKMLQLASQLKLGEDYQNAMLKRLLQKERVDMTSRNRMEQTVQKDELDKQKSLYGV